MQRFGIEHECVAAAAVGAGARVRAFHFRRCGSALHGGENRDAVALRWKWRELWNGVSWESSASGRVWGSQVQSYRCCVASAWNSGSARNEEVKQGKGATEECVNGGAKQESSVSGMMCAPLLRTVGKSTNILWQDCMVSRQERQHLLNQKGCVIWITGLSGSGKSTLACTLDHALLQRGKLSYVLDGDNLRHGLNNNLGFSAGDRAENIRRVGEVAKLFADTGIICIASFISPYQKDRDACRKLVAPGNFVEVFMDVALEVCERRDPKGLYKLARAGKIKGFTGVDDPYERPPKAEIVMTDVGGVYASPQEMTVQMLAYLEDHGYLHGD